MAKSILVVDDDETIRLLVTRVLQSAGYEVRTASDGLEALLAIDKDPPNLLVADINMPELDGLKLASGLRNHPNTRELPVIFITASDDPSHFKESVNVKARYYMTKPFNNDKLVERVKAILGA